MGAQNESFAAKVLAAVNQIGGEVSTTQIFDRLRLQTRASEKKALNALSDLYKSGRVARIRPAVYTIPVGTCLTAPLQERMWRVLRMRRRVTVADLQELAGASREYAEDWLRRLNKRELVKRIDHPSGNQPSTWQLVNDTVEMPELTDNAERLRALRKRKKDEAMVHLATAVKILGQAFEALKEVKE